MFQRHVLLYLTLLFALPLSSQVRLNEAVNSNSRHEDEDGDTPDWFELYNAGPAVNLAGWTVTDRLDKPAKWTFPDLALAADAYQLIWASDKDRVNDFSLRTLIAPGTICRYIVPGSLVDPNWNTADFDDNSWSEGLTSIGFGDGPYATEVPLATRSVFLRHAFSIADPALVEELVLDIDYDDGFVAYVNGREIARANMNENRPAYTATANDASEGRLVKGETPERYSIRDLRGLLRAGENVLSIQVHNVSETSSDMTIATFLSARFVGESTAGTAPPAVIDYASNAPHTNFKISSDGETLYLFDGTQTLIDSLVVAGIPPDLSVGIPVGGGAQVVFEETTPGGQNSTVSYSGVTEGRLTFSRAGGLTDAFALSITGAPVGSIVRYTEDASVPVKSSTLYTGPIDINRNVVIRARIFSGSQLPSPVQTQTYLTTAAHDIDVVTLVTEPDGFFNPQTGIYVLGEGYEGENPFFGSNIWRDVELPMHFSFLPRDGGETFSQDVGTKIFGGWSRANAQRSLSLFARNRYGDGDMDYKFFDTRDYDEFSSLVLRNSGNDWYFSMIRDITMTGLMEGSGLDVQAFRPVATYLNGNYWGLYNLREKINEDYLATRYDIDPDSIDILEFQGQVVEGDGRDYRRLLDFVRENDLSDAENYARVDGEMDIQNFIYYQLAQIYYDNRDWPANNSKYWRSPQLDNKWRWILFDTDFGAAIYDPTWANRNTLEFATEADGPGYPNPPWSTLLLRSLLENEGFRHQFINQLADEMNTRFKYSNANKVISANQDYISKEIPKHDQRWQLGNRSAESTDWMRRFFRERPRFMKFQILDKFDLKNFHNLVVTLNDEAEGIVELNSLTLKTRRFAGDYFEDVPVRLKAIAKDGYAFSHWTGDSDSTEPEIMVNLAEDMSFEPVFRSESSAIDTADKFDGLTDVGAVTYSPNPVSSEARLSLTILRDTRVRAQLFDIRGARVHSFTDERLNPGVYNFRADLSRLPAGAYQLRITEDEARSGVVTWIVN